MCVFLLVVFSKKWLGFEIENEGNKLYILSKFFKISYSMISLENFKFRALEEFKIIKWKNI